MLLSEICEDRSYFTTDGQSVSNVFVSSILVGLATRYYFLSECCCMKFAVLFLWGALSDERSRLQFAVSGSYFTTEGQSVSNVLVSSTLVGLATRYYFL
jgi:hypothetical protein